MTPRKIILKIFIVIMIFSIVFYGIHLFHNIRNKSKRSKSQIENVLNKFFTQIKYGNLENVSQYIDLNNKYYNLNFKSMNKTNEDILKIVFSKINYKIERISVNNSSAKANVKITSIDLLNLYSMYSKELDPLIQTYLNGNEAEKIQAKNSIKIILTNKIDKNIKEENYKKLSGVIKINLKKQDNKWIIEVDRNLIYYLTGKATSLMSK